MSEPRVAAAALVREVGEAAASIVDAYGSHDAASYFSCFSEDATFIFHTHERSLRSRAEYEALWRTWEAEDGFRVRSCRSAGGRVRMLSGDAAVFTHDVTTVVETNRGEEVLRERETIVFARHGGRLLAVHEHLSR